jgi:hypothetical protein
MNVCVSAFVCIARHIKNLGIPSKPQRFVSVGVLLSFSYSLNLERIAANTGT